MGTRIQGALATPGYTVGRNTIKRTLAESGIDQAGRRLTSWTTFLRAHWGAIAATDFFTIEVIAWCGLVRYFALFVIDLKTRRVEIAGIVASPDGAWMAQIARNLTDVERFPASLPLSHSRPRSALHESVSSRPREFRSAPREAPESQPESERVWRAIHPIDQVGVLGAGHSDR
jgi:hypothetical protein